MDRNEIQDIINRIQIEPSVLFLGQRYLDYEKHWSFLDNLNNILKTDLKSFSDIKSLLKGENSLTQAEVNSAIKHAVKDAPMMSWLRRIMFMRWSTIYTSAVDNCMTSYDVVGNFAYNLVPSDADKFKREYLSKNTPYIVKLCLNNEDMQSDSFETDVRKRGELIERRFRWIYDHIIERRGIFVVDGWAPDDMLKPEVLFKISSRMPGYRIFIFGITKDILLNRINDEELQEQLQEDISDGRIVLMEETFPETLEKYGVYDEKDDAQQLFSEDSYVVNIKVRGKVSDGKNLICSFDKNKLDRIGRRITLIHDDIVGDYDDIDKKTALYKFMTQDINIDWNLYNERFNFYAERNADGELYEKVSKQLNLSAYNRKPVILAGPSNSGKTATLINFALKAKREGLTKPSIIFYVSGDQKDELSDSKSDWITELSELCKDELASKQKIDETAINIIIVWDNYSDDQISKYKSLQERMYDSNVMVIGSSYYPEDHYRRGEAEFVNIDADLKQEEFDRFKEKLQDIKPEWENYLDQSYKKDRRIFSILSRIALYEDNEEWHNMGRMIRERLDREATVVEDTTRNAIVKFDQEIFEQTNEKIAQYGIGADIAYQLEFSSEDEENADKAEKALEDIKWINKLLAVAGQFGLSLPLSLIMYILYEENEYNMMRRDKFVKDVVSRDSLVNCEVDSAGNMNVRFRHYSEAQAYLKTYLDKHFKNDEDKKNEEIQLLLFLICYCDWGNSNESECIIKLIRKFGPNSDGKPGEVRADGEYKNYKKYWKEIVKELDKCDIDDNYEAILVKCHLLRESADDESDDYNATALLHSSRTMLRDIFIEHKTANEAQLSRIGGELCAGLNVEMKKDNKKGDRNNFEKHFQSFRQYFQSAYDYYRNSTKNNKRVRVSSNVLLDIWLNAFENYSEYNFMYSDVKKYTEEYKRLVAKSLYYVSELMTISDNTNSDNYDLSSLMKKIDSLFKISGDILGSSSDNIEGYRSRLERAKNDGYVFMVAMRYFIENAADFEFSDEEHIRNHEKGVLWFLNEEGNRYIEQERMNDLKKRALNAAKKTVAWFEEPRNKNLIEESKSERCEYLYLKSKWLVDTGCLLLEEKQRPVLSKEKWDIYNDICREYIRYCKKDNNLNAYVRPAAYFIRAIYDWIYEKRFTQGYPFNELKEYNLNRNLQRIGLCDDKGSMLKLRVRMSMLDNKPKAVIKDSFTPNDYFKTTQLKGKYNIPITKAAENKIYGGKKPSNRNEYSPAVIWFRIEGPQLDIPSERGGRDE